MNQANDLPVHERLLVELDEAEAKAWDALSRYKFQMFGYWSAIWVHLNRISGANRPNPWGRLVQIARYQRSLAQGQLSFKSSDDLRS